MANRPINFNDPTGHTSLCNAACEEKDERKIPTIDETLSKYGIDAQGNGWTSIRKAYLLAAVLAVAKRLTGKSDKDPSEVFKSVYGITDSNPLAFVMGSCNPRTKADGSTYGGCADEDGNKKGAYTWGSREIEFYEGSPFAKLYGYRTRNDVYNANIHLVVHELGHAFANRFGSSSTINPYLMVDQAKFNDELETSYLSSVGFHSPPNDSISGYWRPNQDITQGETFANMFLGWVFDTWSTDTYGTQRSVYMSENMQNIWLPALSP